MHLNAVIIAMSSSPFEIAVAVAIILPLAVIITLVIVGTSYSGSPTRKSSLIYMLLGTAGAIAGTVIALEIYWHSHGPENAFLYVIPGALSGGVLVILIARLFRWFVARRRVDGHSADTRQHEHDC